MSHNKIFFSLSDANKTDKDLMPDGYNYFLSLTRQSSPDVGYVATQNKSKNIRPTFDYSGLKKYKLGKNDDEKNYTHVYADSRGVKWGIKDNNNQYNRGIIVNYSESEERILSNVSFLDNAYDYIKRIDIFSSLNNLKVRIAFDGEKLNTTYKSSNVDFFNKKYVSDVSTLGKKSKTVNEVAKTFLRKKEWEGLKSFLKDVEITVKTGKSTTAKRTLQWFKKIFVHLGAETRHLGVNMLNSASIQDKLKEKHVASYDVWGKMANKFSKKERPIDTAPIIKKGDIEVLLNFMFLILSDKESIHEKISYGFDMCRYYFGNCVVIFNGPGNNNEKHILSDLLTHNLEKTFLQLFNELERRDDNNKRDFITGLYRNISLRRKQTLIPYAHDVYLIMKNILRDFDKRHPDINTGLPTYIFNKFYRSKDAQNSNRGRKAKGKQSFEEDMIKEMALKVLELLKENDK